MIFLFCRARGRSCWGRVKTTWSRARGEVPAPRLEPAFAGTGLTLRAVPVSAGVIGDGGAMSAAGALIEMTAECGGAATRNGQQHFEMWPADPLAVALDEGGSRGADQIGNLERRWAHGSTSSLLPTWPTLISNPLGKHCSVRQAKRPPPGGYVQTRISSVLDFLTTLPTSHYLS